MKRIHLSIQFFAILFSASMMSLFSMGCGGVNETGSEFSSAENGERYLVSIDRIVFNSARPDIEHRAVLRLMNETGDKVSVESVSRPVSVIETVVAAAGDKPTDESIPTSNAPMDETTVWSADLVGHACKSDGVNVSNNIVANFFFDVDDAGTALNHFDLVVQGKVTDNPGEADDKWIDIYHADLSTIKDKTLYALTTETEIPLRAALQDGQDASSPGSIYIHFEKMDQCTIEWSGSTK